MDTLDSEIITRAGKVVPKLDLESRMCIMEDLSSAKFITSHIAGIEHFTMDEHMMQSEHLPADQ